MPWQNHYSLTACGEPCSSHCQKAKEKREIGKNTTQYESEVEETEILFTDK